jgi:hypothetical protein
MSVHCIPPVWKKSDQQGPVHHVDDCFSKRSCTSTLHPIHHTPRPSPPFPIPFPPSHLCFQIMSTSLATIPLAFHPLLEYLNRNLPDKLPHVPPLFPNFFSHPPLPTSPALRPSSFVHHPSSIAHHPLPINPGPPFVSFAPFRPYRGPNPQPPNSHWASSPQWFSDPASVPSASSASLSGSALPPFRAFRGPNPFAPIAIQTLPLRKTHPPPVVRTVENCRNQEDQNV